MYIGYQYPHHRTSWMTGCTGIPKDTCPNPRFRRTERTRYRHRPPGVPPTAGPLGGVPWKPMHPRWGEGAPTGQWLCRRSWGTSRTPPHWGKSVPLACSCEALRNIRWCLGQEVGGGMWREHFVTGGNQKHLHNWGSLHASKELKNNETF